MSTDVDKDGVSSPAAEFAVGSDNANAVGTRQGKAFARPSA